MRTESLRHHELQESVSRNLWSALFEYQTHTVRSYLQLHRARKIHRYSSHSFHLAHACCTRKLAPEKDIQNIGAALERATEWARCVSAERRESRYCVPSFLLYFFPPCQAFRYQSQDS